MLVQIIFITELSIKYNKKDVEQIKRLFKCML